MYDFFRIFNKKFDLIASFPEIEMSPLDLSKQEKARNVGDLVENFREKCIFLDIIYFIEKIGIF
jgi:hypothetical protein